MTNESTRQMAEKQTEFSLNGGSIDSDTSELSKVEMDRISQSIAAETEAEAELAADSGDLPLDGVHDAVSAAHTRMNPTIGHQPDFDRIAGADESRAGEDLGFGSNSADASDSDSAEVLDLGAPHIDESVKAPIEADAALLHDIGSIPAKMAFKIGEAAEMVGVKQYVLRYWETEFDMLRPRKSSNGQRVYSRKEVETAMMIKKLLYNDRFSIEGARHALRQLKSTVKTTVAEEKTTEKLARSQEHIVDAVQSLLSEIRRARATFS